MNKKTESELIANRGEIMKQVMTLLHAIRQELGSECDYNTAWLLAWDQYVSEHHPSESANEVKGVVTAANAASARAGRRKKKASPEILAPTQPALISPNGNDSEIAILEQRLLKIEKEQEAVRERIKVVKAKSEPFKGEYVSVQVRREGTPGMKYRLRGRHKKSPHISQCESLREANKLAASIDEVIKLFVEERQHD